MGGIDLKMTACLRIGNLEPLNVAMVTHSHGNAPKQEQSQFAHYNLMTTNFYIEQMFSSPHHQLKFEREKIDHRRNSLF